MIKKLRLRFLVVNMAILTTVLISVLVGIFVLMYSSEVSQSEEIMHATLERYSNMAGNQRKSFEPPKNSPALNHKEDASVNSSNRPNAMPQKPPDSMDNKQKKNLVGDTIYISLSKDKQIEYVHFQYLESYTSDQSFIESIASAAFKSGKSKGKFEVSDIDFRYIYEKNPNGYKLVVLNRSMELSTLGRLLITFTIIGAISIVLLLGMSFLLANWTIKPIAIAWDKQKQFVADASHELKTPLTVIAANTDVVLANEDDLVKNQSKWLMYIKEETNRMSKIVTNLLYIAKFDANNKKPVFEKINLGHLILGVCLVFEPLIFENGKILETDISNDIEYFGDEDELKHLATILIDNALKYSSKSSEITVQLKEENKRIRFEVSNKGSTIPNKHLEHIFERFYRIDESRNRNTGGSGLGLNIAKSIVERHKGSISVKSKDNKATFTVLL
ncbi:MAG: GHKL domain-containing protein [Clostridiales bacterium]|nr:GHKL domain-containing protein [Clostridiales bacterium]